jgi:peptide/nickel transport system substrate-binding protein
MRSVEMSPRPACTPKGGDHRGGHGGHYSTRWLSVWVGEAQRGTFDITINIQSSVLIDPSDYFRAWYSKDGPQNFSQWHNPAFEALLAQIDRELDEAKRKDLVRQAEAIFAQDQPLLPVSWEKINDGWFNYVKGHNPYNYFSIYDVGRFDAFWLDT